MSGNVSSTPSGIYRLVIDDVIKNMKENMKSLDESQIDDFKKEWEEHLLSSGAVESLASKEQLHKELSVSSSKGADSGKGKKQESKRNKEVEEALSNIRTQDNAINIAQHSGYASHPMTAYSNALYSYNQQNPHYINQQSQQQRRSPNNSMNYAMSQSGYEMNQAEFENFGKPPQRVSIDANSPMNYNLAHLQQQHQLQSQHHQQHHQQHHHYPQHQYLAPYQTNSSQNNYHTYSPGLSNLIQPNSNNQYGMPNQGISHTPNRNTNPHSSSAPSTENILPPMRYDTSFFDNEPQRKKTREDDYSTQRHMNQFDGNNTDDEALGSDDDLSDSDSESDDENTSTLVALYDKISRIKTRYKCHLKYGIINIEGKDKIFEKGTADLNWK